MYVRKTTNEKWQQEYTGEKNILVFKEKPYYTNKELELYYRIAIDEFQKSGHPEMAAHYQILLNMLLNKDK